MRILLNLKDPHPKALKPDCLSPFLAIATQSLKAGPWSRRLTGKFKLPPAERKEGGDSRPQAFPTWEYGHSAESSEGSTRG